MKRIGGVWSQLSSFENLLLAYRKARRGKSRSQQVQRFALDLEPMLLGLQQQLIDKTYHPGKYRLFRIYERKPRIIAAAPFRDRVVHHAILNIIDPVIDRRFISDSYACRKSKGVHAAVNRYQNWARGYPYVLKMDIQRYFPSIDRTLLKQNLRRYVKDRHLLWLLDQIVDNAPVTADKDRPNYFPGDDLLSSLERPCGIPIGNLTSQFFANLFLDDLDHWIKQELCISCYLRYVDDLVFLGRDKNDLAVVRQEVDAYLQRKRLHAHPHKSHIYHVAHGIDLLGYQVFPFKRRLRSDNGFRFRRRLRAFARAYAKGETDWADFDSSVQSWIGHALHADTQGLRKAIFERTVFQRGQHI